MPITISASTVNVRALQNAAQNALDDIGLYVVSKAAKYPPQRPGSTYVRIGTLGRSITKTKAMKYGSGYRVRVGTFVNYAQDVEFGTGMHGKNKTPIVPKTAKVLAWTASRGGLEKAGMKDLKGTRMIAMGLGKYSKGRFRHSAKHDTMMIFRHSVQGMEGWHFMEKAFTDPQTRAYADARMRKMAGSISFNLRTTGAK
jgi:hypothetical protein